MGKADPKMTLIVWIVCCIIWSGIAVVRFVYEMPLAWLSAVAALAFLIGSIRAYLFIRKNRDG